MTKNRNFNSSFSKQFVNQNHENTHAVRECSLWFWGRCGSLHLWSAWSSHVLWFYFITSLIFSPACFSWVRQHIQQIQKSTWQGHLLSEILISITILQLPIIMSKLIKDNYRAPVKLAEIYLVAQQKSMFIYTKTSYASFAIFSLQWMVAKSGYEKGKAVIIFFVSYCFLNGSLKMLSFSHCRNY